MGFDRGSVNDSPRDDVSQLERMRIPFAIKDYYENTNNQILKALGAESHQEWNDTDLTKDSEYNRWRRAKKKAQLMETDPCLFVGSQGRAMAECKGLEPLFVREATIPRGKIQHNSQGHDLRVVIIFWTHIDSRGRHLYGSLTLYNNQFDQDAVFLHLVSSGTSDPCNTGRLIRKYGIGFIQSTSVLTDMCNLNLLDRGSEDKTPTGVLSRASWGRLAPDFGLGFNVGHIFGKVKSEGSSKLLRVHFREPSLEDVQGPNTKGHGTASGIPIGANDKLNKPGSLLGKSARLQEPSNKKDARKTTASKARFAKERLGSEKSAASKRPTANQRLQGVRGPALVRNDDLCIHIIGFPKCLTAQEAFSAVYGMFPEKRVWRISGSNVEIYEAVNPPGRFYNRGNLISLQSPLGVLGVNCDLQIASDPFQEARSSKVQYGQLEQQLGKILTFAIENIPELAILLMQHSFHAGVKGQECPMRWINPESKDRGDEWREAFEAALGAPDRQVYPFVDSDQQAMSMILELGFDPVAVKDWQMRILERAGAYQSIEEYAEEMRGCAAHQTCFQPPGLSILRGCIQRLITDQNLSFFVQQSADPNPQVIEHDGRITVAEPDIDECPKGQCICWVRPTLVRTMLARNEEVDWDLVFHVYDQLVREAQGHKQVKETQSPKLETFTPTSSKFAEHSPDASEKAKPATSKESQEDDTPNNPALDAYRWLVRRVARDASRRLGFLDRTNEDSLIELANKYGFSSEATSRNSADTEHCEPDENEEMPLNDEAEPEKNEDEAEAPGEEPISKRLRVRNTAISYKLKKIRKRKRSRY